jgi:hypothetical protein
MADVFFYLLKVAGAFSTTILGPSTNFSDILRISRSGTTRWQRHGAPVVLALRGAVEQYLQIEDLLNRDDGYLMAYKESYVQECNMVAVAVSAPALYCLAPNNFGFGLSLPACGHADPSLQAAIIASVAMTALQLPSLLLSHWLAQALMVFSLVIGLFSVYAACAQQRLVTNLATPMQIRSWLSTPNYFYHGSGKQAALPGTTEARNTRTNTASVLTLTAPRTLLDHSIRFFVTGLGIYLTCAYTNEDLYTNTATGVHLGNPNGSRNVVVIFSFSVILGISLLISPSSSKNFQNDLSFSQTNLARPVLGDEKGLITAIFSAIDEGRQVQILQQALRDAALSHRRIAEELRKSADADEQVARAYEKLGES